MPSGPVGRWLIGPWLDRIGRAMNRSAFAALEVRPGETVVEIGFGGGELIDRLLGAEAVVIGVDRSRVMRARAARRFAAAIAQGRLHLHVASIERIPLEDGGADKAVSVNTLYFWADLPGAIAELARVLRPGGQLLLCFQTPESVRRWPGHRHGFIAYSAADVAAALRQSRLALVSEARGRDHHVGDYLCLKAIK